MSLFRNIYHPARYHGHGRPPPYFEGWYYKIVDAAEEHPLAIIPAIFKSLNAERHHAFIQVLEGRSGAATYHRFPAGVFRAATQRFDIHVGGNRFQARELSLALEDDQRSLHGTLTFGPLAPWPIRPFSPGVMGPFGLIPFMECYHGVLSFDHALHGSLTLDGRTIDYSGGRGYIEKDWGSAFPAGYVWMQSNHFDSTGTSFFGSIAVIPWLGSAFAGFIAGLWHDGRLYPFTTYNGGRAVHLEITDDHVSWVMRTGRAEIAIEAERAQGGLLLGPNRENMAERVGETMLATIDIRLSRWERGRPAGIIFEGRGRNGGLEVHGDQQRLLALQKKAVGD